MKVPKLRYQPKWTIFLVIIVLLLSNACTLPSSTEPENQPPTIHYIAADKEIALSDNAQIRCEATDKDKDTLSYRWSADWGMIEGTGDTITWILLTALVIIPSMLQQPMAEVARLWIL